MPSAIRIKGCQRCGGDVFFERDEHGLSASCVQCGAVYYPRYDQQKVRRLDERAPARVGSGNVEPSR